MRKATLESPLVRNNYGKISVSLKSSQQGSNVWFLIKDRVIMDDKVA